MLDRHISKENDVVYTFAERQLSPEVMETVNEAVNEFEQRADEEYIQKKYLKILNTLEKTYIKL